MADIVWIPFFESFRLETIAIWWLLRIHLIIAEPRRREHIRKQPSKYACYGGMSFLGELRGSMPSKTWSKIRKIDLDVRTHVTKTC